MFDKKLLTIFAGATQQLQNSKKYLVKTCQDTIEEKILRDKYVTREEYEVLKNMVMELQNKIKDNEIK